MTDRTSKHGADAREETPWLSLILPHVRANARPGSKLQKAAETFNVQRDRETGPTFGACYLFAEAWREVGAQEQMRLLNGWRPLVEWPNQAEVLRMFTYGVDPVLRVELQVDGSIGMDREFLPSDGSIAPLVLNVRAATDPATILAGLRAIATAFEVHLVKAITLGPGECISVPPPSGEAPANSVAEALDSVSRRVGEIQAMLKGAATSDDGPGVESAFAKTAEGREFRFRLVNALGLDPGNAWSTDELLEAVGELRAAGEAHRKKMPHGSKIARKLGGKERKSKTSAAN